ncbi:ATP-dependent Clp protease adapter ClpS [Enhydrobacter sp.]|uniref:ATP-dependent Clp protease adapter ClpS n=1 Tax=Enhydrobacter sp. TaxID=1894999 RepID=UPI00261DAB46|nr:ATP-dependent Clp protease adapter ClpS [Enhydrobacter sp.]
MGGPQEPPGGAPPQPPRREDGERDNEGRTGALTLTRTRTKKPSMYKVLMLNDDYTPMEFVVDVLQHIFQKNREEATQIMLHVHQKGVGVCGVYTYEVAETKVTQTVDYARKNQHPLQCTLEKE